MFLMSYKMFALTFLIQLLHFDHMSAFNLYKRSQLQIISGKIMQVTSRSKTVCEIAQLIMIAITFYLSGC
ncbi:hypothetical protein BZP36_19980 [Raoultella terrigena]|nr:hypothetical protein BZP36_19980 [Raoultella terrigena]